MPDTPIPFLQSLKRSADGFANGIHAMFWLSAIFLAGWFLLSFITPLDAPPKNVREYVRVMAIIWLAFFATAALIDYTIHAVFHAFSEFLGAAMRAVAESVTQSAAEEAAAAAPASAPDQRDSTVAYLHDILDMRKPQVSNDVDPLNPTPPPAAA